MFLLLILVAMVAFVNKLDFWTTPKMKDIFAEFYGACRQVEMSTRTSHVACRMSSIITIISYLCQFPQPNHH